jgi:uncharacterized membrane protein YdbT with pleckstrin-like domain
MSYIDNNLLVGEAIAYRTHLHWKLFTIPALVSLLVLLPVSIWALSSERRIVAAIALLIAVVWIGAAYLYRRTSEFAVTNKRVVMKVGVLSTRSVELLLSKVEGIAVTQSLLGRMLGYGEIVVSGSGGTKEFFAGIQSPLRFRQAVQAATDAIS